MLGPHILLSYYVAHVISCPGALSSFVTLPGLSLWFFRTCLGLRGTNTSGHTKCAFLLRDALFILAFALAGRLGLFHAVSFPGSLSWSWGEVSFAFVTGFVAKTQAPPLLLGLRASLYRPNQRETIAMGDLYPVRAVRCYLVRFGCALSAMRAFPFFHRLKVKGH